MTNGYDTNTTDVVTEQSSKIISPEQNKTIIDMLHDSELHKAALARQKTQHSRRPQIEQTGTKLILPANLTPPEAAAMVAQWAEAQEQVTTVTEKIVGLPYDAANALLRTVENEFGCTSLKEIPPTFFSAGKPPAFLRIPTSARGDYTEVFIGQMTLPGLVDSCVETWPDDDGLALNVRCTFKKKDERFVTALLDRTRQYLINNSIYRGKALRITDMGDPDSGKPMMPEFFDFPLDMPLLNADVETLVRAQIWTPILHTEKYWERGVHVNGARILHGGYGCGKTMIAHATAHIASQSSTPWTVFYLKTPEATVEVLGMAAKLFNPAIVFVEDIDKLMTNQSQIDALQAAIDGIDTKTSDTMLIATTNHIELMHPGVCRPSRTRAIIEIGLPDPATRLAMIRRYASGHLDPSDTLQHAVKELEGLSGGAIADVCQRAYNFALSRAIERDEPIIRINSADLVGAKDTMIAQLDMSQTVTSSSVSAAQLFGGEIGAGLGSAVIQAVSSLVSEEAFERQPIRKPKKVVN